MKPEEKAKDLVRKFIEPTLIDFSDENFEATKRCALICVDEIIKSHNPVKVKTGWNFEPEYWLEVYSEIEKL